MVLAGCGKIEQNDDTNAGKVRAETKRQKTACASSGAYNRLKGLLFDQAIAQHSGNRANLDTLADYSSARMEDPVVEGWDPALEITRCKGRFILDIPPGAERAFEGERHLEANLRYTAQAAADGNGLVYRLSGAEPIIAKLAAFNLTSGAYRPPPAIDEQDGVEMAAADKLAPTGLTEAAPPAAPPRSVPLPDNGVASHDRQEVSAIEDTPSHAVREFGSMTRATSATDTGAATVRAFYGALGAGDGTAASARIIPEKRSSGAFSSAAMSQFYGKLPEPMRLTDVTPLGRGRYRVRYRYSAGRSHCDGSAVVRTTNLAGRDLIRSIQALNGC